MLFVGALPLFSVRISRRAAFGVVFSLISANVYREVVFMSFFLRIFCHLVLPQAVPS